MKKLLILLGIVVANVINSFAQSQITNGAVFPGFISKDGFIVNVSSNDVSANCIKFRQDALSLLVSSTPIAVPVGFATVTVSGLAGSPKYVKVHGQIRYTEDATAAAHIGQVFFIEDIWSQKTLSDGSLVAAERCAVALNGQNCDKFFDTDVFLDTVTFNRFM